MLVAFATPQPSFAVSRVPIAGSPERALILKAVHRDIEEGTAFVVDHLRVADLAGLALAYAEVHPASRYAVGNFSGWVVLVRENGRWRALWAIEAAGRDRCDVLHAAYDRTYDLAKLYGAADDLFTPTFLARRESVAHDRGPRCDGGFMEGAMDTKGK